MDDGPLAFCQRPFVIQSFFESSDRSMPGEVDGTQSAATSVGFRCFRKDRIASTTVCSPALVLIMA